jgi:protein SCO1/2
MTARARLLLAAAAVCAAFAGFWLAHQLDREAPQLASGTWLPWPKAVADFRLLDASGQPFTRQDLIGRPALIFFGFTHCPDVCPTTLLKLARIKREAAVPGLRVVFVSVDPQRDTPPLLGMYVHAFDASFEGLTGDDAAIGKLAANFSVAVNRVELPGGDYTMDHSAVVFLLDRQARMVAIFTPPFEVRTFSADLKRAAAYLGRAPKVAT